MNGKNGNHSPPLPPRITDAEWKVMMVFWENGEAATLRDIVESLENSGPDWKLRTVQTLIRRLVKKGALTVEEKGREFRYSAAVSQADCQQDESRSFLGRVFEGRLVPFMAGMVANEEISRDEIEELRRMLDEAAVRQTEQGVAHE